MSDDIFIYRNLNAFHGNFDSYQLLFEIPQGF